MSLTKEGKMVIDKESTLLLLRVGASFSSLVIAGALAHKGRNGWGWFLFAAVLFGMGVEKL